MQGVNTLKHGYIWRVGDGEKINIWRDAWIPNSPSRMIIAPRGNQLLSKVSDLIDSATGHWDVPLVEQTFWPIDVERVLALPLPTHDMSDFVAWSLNKHGIFTVKSAYHALWYFQHGRKLQRTDGLGATSANPTWEKVWKLNCPAKVKKFLWRTLHGTLPCNVVLANRHIPVRPTCPACKQGAEDVFHVLFRCHKAREVWRQLGLEDVIRHACGVDRAGEEILSYLNCHALNSKAAMF